jgi:hypothetical protein
LRRVRDCCMFLYKEAGTSERSIDMTQYPGFTTMTARDLEAGWTVRVPGKPRTACEAIEVTKGAVDVSITWADGSFTALHGNTYVQVQIW